MYCDNMISKYEMVTLYEMKVTCELCARKGA